MQAALVRAQQHILDLQEQHSVDVKELRHSHAQALLELHTRHCSLERALAAAKQADTLHLCSAMLRFSSQSPCTGVSLFTRNAECQATPDMALWKRGVVL